jgi:uncharacterized membrane protein
MSKKALGILLSAMGFVLVFLGTAFYYASQYIELAVKTGRSASFGIYNEKMYTEYNNDMIHLWGTIIILISIALQVYGLVLLSKIDDKPAVAPERMVKVNEESMKALERLSELKKNGILSEEEFTAQKQKIL